MNKTITVSAPGKLMLLGEHAVIYNRPCLVTAVDQRLSVTINPISIPFIILNSPDLGVENSRFPLPFKQDSIPKSASFVINSVHNFFEKYHLSHGLEISTHNSFSSQFGFGSSSAVTVGTIYALAQLFSINITKMDLFELCYKTVLDVQGVGSGFDLAAAIWGGTLRFVTGGKEIVPLQIKSLPLIVAYTGIKADTTTLIKQVATLHNQNPKNIDSIFDNIENLVNEGTDDLRQNNLDRFGQLMNSNQELLETLGVGSPTISHLISIARSAGSLGAKLSGAGVGDCIIVLAAPGKLAHISQAITNSGGQIISVQTNTEGVRIEK